MATTQGPKNSEIFFSLKIDLVWHPESSEGFGLASLFNGISTFVGYLMPKLLSQKNNSGTHNWEDKGVFAQKWT